MKTNENLINRSVLLYLDGGWQVSGVVQVFEESKIVLSDGGNLILVSRDKVSAMMVSSSANQPKPTGQTKESNASEVSHSSESFPMNGISYENSGLSIPSDIIGRKDDDNDFSITFSNSNGISFGLEDDISEET